MKKRLLLLFIPLLLLSGCKKEEPSVRTEYMMDTIITLKIYDGENERAMDRAVERLKEIESLMSAHIEDSHLSEINRAAGESEVKVDNDLYMIIEKAIEIAEISGGVYEPSIGPLVDLWDIKGEGSQERKTIPSQDEIDKARDLVNYRDIELLADNKVYLKKKGMKLDLGSIVKGYAADEVRRIFEEEGVKSAIIDLGGNIFAMNVKPDKSPWSIGIQSPFDEASYLGILKMDNQTIVTSGDYERYFELDGKRYHHIIDPRTGYPSENELGGISIVSNNSMEADALSTSVFILGLEKGQELLEYFEDTDAIYVSKDRTIVLAEKFKDKFELKDDSFTLK